jgi:hypothetical protein
LLPTNAGEIDKLCLTSSHDFAKANEGFAQMDTWIQIQKNILHDVGSAFVKGVYIPYGSLVTMESVHIVIPTELAKQMKKWLRK